MLEKLAIKCLTIYGGKSVKACKKCGLLPKDCKCDSRKGANSREEIVRCNRCSAMTQNKYLKSYGSEEICGNCLEVAAIPLDEIEYYKGLANKYGFKLYHIKTHLRAANFLNKDIGSYLAEMPRTHEAYTDYFKGTENEELARSMVK